MEKTILSIDPHKMDRFTDVKDLSDELDRRFGIGPTYNSLDSIWNLNVDGGKQRFNIKLAADDDTKEFLIEMNDVHSGNLNQELIDLIDYYGIDKTLAGKVDGVSPIGVSLDMGGMVTISFAIDGESNPPYTFICLEYCFSKYSIFINVYEGRKIVEKYKIHIKEDGKVSISKG